MKRTDTDRTDTELCDSIAGDPFHKGLEEHGEFIGFKSFDPMSEHEIKVAQNRVCGGDKVPGMTDEELEISRSRLSRMCINGKLGLFLTYIATLALMAKTYA